MLISTIYFYGVGAFRRPAIAATGLHPRLRCFGDPGDVG